MKRSALKWTVLGGVLVFIVLYGMEMSSTGIERIYGPIEGSGASSISLSQQADSSVEGVTSSVKDTPTGLTDAAERKIAKLEEELAEVREIAERNNRGQRLPGVSGDPDVPAVNKLADGTAGMLQSVTTGGIRFVVSLFDSVTN
ncbi:MAG: hypothetical protein ACE3L7_25465 [Candidatus Pristimantibacillus sp.]